MNDLFSFWQSGEWLPEVEDDLAIGAFEMQEIDISQSDIEYVWGELQAVPSYLETEAARFARKDLSQLVAQAMDAPLPVVMEDAPLHTDARPFCADATCPCHADDALFDLYIRYPVCRYAENLRSSGDSIA